jgi:hypothetical protein
MTDWTDEQRENAIRYGICHVCHTPREIQHTKDANGRLIALNVGCPNGHDQDDWQEADDNIPTLDGPAQP